MKGNTLFFVLVLSLVLSNNGIAHDRDVELRGKGVSCKVLRSMGRVYMAYGEYGKAQPLVEQALALARKTNVSDYELAMCLIDTACLYENQNKLIDAEKMCEDGLKLQEKVLYENHPYIAYTLRILSSIYRKQNKYSQAKIALDRAKAIMLSSHTEDDDAMVPLQVDTAKLLVAQGKLTEAESYYSNALSTINKSWGPNHLYTATVLENIAELYLLQGKYLEAEPLINQAFSMKEKAYGLKHHFLVPTLFIKASIERAKGSYATSEKFIHRALAAVERTRNITRIVESQQRAEEIRADKIIAHELLAKAVN